MIAELLTDISRGVSEANNLIEHISASGQERVGEVENAVKAINEVAQISKESATTAAEITSNTEEQTASMQEMTASAQELANSALDLKNLVNKFKLSKIDKSARA